MRKGLLLVFVAGIVSVLSAKTKVACIGDSITFGYKLPNRETTSYPAQLQKILDEKCPGVYEVRNFGNSSRGVYLDALRPNKEKRGYRHMKEHREAVAWKPDIVVCNLGINDVDDYMKEKTGLRPKGQFVGDYMALLGDYAKASHPKFYIWTKLAPVTDGLPFYRSPAPFLMQDDLEEVARRVKGTGLDMQTPLRDDMDAIFAGDHLHPDPAGARLIAETTAAAITRKPEKDPLDKSFLKGKPKGEFWLFAGQSNMQKGWVEFSRPGVERQRAEAEMARLDKVNVFFWDFNTRVWTKLTSKNGMQRSAVGVSFAIRRAEQTKKAVYMLYVASGGAPTEAFLSEQTMCKVDASGKPIYPRLAKIATNRHQLQTNDDFPCLYCKTVYPQRKGPQHEANWWPVSLMYDNGIKLIRESGLPLSGVLWYQGESNATTGVKPDVPLETAYVEETLRAIVDELRGGKKIPFVMMGLPKFSRSWDSYRAAQKKVCAETGAVFVDTFGAGLGDMRDIHPRDKTPFADLAIATLSEPCAALRALPRNEVAWWKDRFARNLSEIKNANGKIDLVFLGDSITDNWEKPGKDILADLRKTYTILSAGYSGDRTENVLWRIRNGELDGYKAKAVMLMIGTNNTWHRKDPPEDVAKGIRAILDVIAKKQPQAKVVLLPIFPIGERADDPRRIANEKINALIRPLADGKKVIWIDFNDRLVDASGSMKKYASDAVHPDPPGYAVWRDAVLPAFRRICGK